MSTCEAEEATPCGGDGGALKRRATPSDASRAGKLHVPALVDAHLASIVRGYEELYMIDHPLYADRQRRRDVWEEISTIVNHPAGACIKRWTRIRNNYFRSVKRAQQQSNEPVYQARDKLMSFLKPTFEKKYAKYDKHATTVLISDKEAPELENDDSSDIVIGLSGEKHSADVCDSSSSDDVQGPTIPAADAAPAPGPQHSQLKNDDVVDFFVELGESVKDFPESVRFQVKSEAFRIVTDAEEMLYHQKIKTDLEMDVFEDNE